MPLPLRVHNNLTFLESLCNAKRKIAERIRRASDDELLTIVEIAYNLIKLCYTPTHEQLRRMRSFGTVICQLAGLRSRRKAEKLLVVQPPRFYSCLLQPL